MASEFSGNRKSGTRPCFGQTNPPQGGRARALAATGARLQPPGGASSEPPPKKCTYPGRIPVGAPAPGCLVSLRYLQADGSAGLVAGYTRLLGKGELVFIDFFGRETRQDTAKVALEHIFGKFGPKGKCADELRETTLEGNSTASSSSSSSSGGSKTKVEKGFRKSLRGVASVFGRQYFRDRVKATCGDRFDAQSMPT